MQRLSQYCLLLLLSCCLNAYGQSGKEKDDCFLKLGNSFVSDGQDHQLVLQGNKFTQLNIIFLPQFRYHLVLCNKNMKTPVVMNLKDNKGNIIYSDRHSKDWNFQFDALLKGSIELKLEKESDGEEIISLIIGYKPI